MSLNKKLPDRRILVDLKTINYDGSEVPRSVQHCATKELDSSQMKVARQPTKNGEESGDLFDEEVLGP